MVPPPPISRYGDARSEADIREEADFYNSKATERSFIGEGYNGATNDWAIIDVPPGTKRVTMDGVGGGKQEITWQRYNGVRRSKFLPDGRGEARRFGGEGRDRERSKEMWTEITKDLVVKEAIEQVGWEYEETEFFFYVMRFLGYVGLPLSP